MIHYTQYRYDEVEHYLYVAISDSVPRDISYVVCDDITVGYFVYM